MHGFPGRRTMTLRCELFGQAGDYALTLRPAAAAGPQDLATSFIKVRFEISYKYRRGFTRVEVIVAV